MPLLRSAVAALLALHLLTAAAQDDFLIPCVGSPAESVLQLPPPLNDWGKVYCTKFGHTLAARDRWIWSFPGALAPVHLPAQMVRDQPKEVGNAAYFKRIELLTLKGQDAQDAVAKINGKLGTRSNASVSAAYHLTLVNQEGDTHEVLFAITQAEVELGKGHWGMWCDRNCSDGSPFMLLNHEKQAK